MTGEEIVDCGGLRFSQKLCPQVELLTASLQMDWAGPQGLGDIDCLGNFTIGAFSNQLTLLTAARATGFADVALNSAQVVASSKRQPMRSD